MRSQKGSQVDDIPAIADFVDILAFLVHIHSSLASLAADPCHIAHFRVGKVVLVRSNLWQGNILAGN